MNLFDVNPWASACLTIFQGTCPMFQETVMRVTRTLFVLSLAGALAPAAMGQWGTSFVNETSTRLVMNPALQNDNLEKDFGFGDFDKDGDVDLVVMRKFPGSIQGGFPNILLMNEGGVLVERTNVYGTASDVAGDLGLLAPTNDRDVKVADVDGDTWLDLVTFTTMSDQVNDVLGQPRVYRNLGNDGNGNWLGFKFENARIPTLFAKNGSAANPRACDGAVADLTGDGFPDIFFVDYDTPETSGTVCIDLNGDGDTNDAGECQQSPAETATKDYDNKFLVNWGNDPNGPGPGYFFDTTTTRFTSAQLASAFGNAVAAVDLNGDGAMDIVRINTLTGGQNVATLYGKPNDLGNSFNGPDQVTAGAPYNMDIADLNGDGKLDIVVVDDSQDKFLINTGNGADTFANFTSFTIADSLAEFGNTARIADLDNDGKLDVMIADVDADLPPFCPTSGRRARIYRNTGLAGAAMLDEVGTIIPVANLAATYDFAPIDIDGDGWLDLVIGRCAGIEVWKNKPPLGITFSYPGGTPSTLVPGETTTFQVGTTILGGGSFVSGTLDLTYRIDGGPWTSVDLSGGPTVFSATLPALDCGQSIDYYVSGKVSNSPATYADPANAPTSFYSATPITGTNLVYTTIFENGTDGWNVANQNVAAGAWVLAAPVGTTNGGVPAQASADAPGCGTQAWVTGNGLPGGTAAASDLDGGPSLLVSPSIAVNSGLPVTIEYTAWVYCDDFPANPSQADTLRVEVSWNGGTSWSVVRSISTTSSAWANFTDQVIAQSNSMQVRFNLADNPNNSTLEGGLAKFTATSSECVGAPACVADFNSDGDVNGADLAALLGAWGSVGGPLDLDASGSVDGGDLAVLLGAWGACP
jgi:hypothetical protein